MKLVISEKNIAAKRIAYILSGGKVSNTRVGNIPVYEFSRLGEKWRVVGLKGHIINLDFPPGFNKWNDAPPQDLITVEPCKKISQKNIAIALKILVDKNPYLIVATDFDREGELIGVEVINLLKEYNKEINQIKRAKFSAITPNEIMNAFNKLVEVDYNLSNAGESRQVIDLIWGAVLTRFISLTAHRLGKDFLSIGRVQSPTLALVVEREKEIQNFNPKTYWKIIATINKKEPFDATHIEGQFWDEKQVKKIYEKLKESKDAIIIKINKQIVKELPPTPFNTTSFLESASHLGISAVRAMAVAEELYMSGLISYPRTDNTVYPTSMNVRNILQNLSNSDFSKEVNWVIENRRPYPTRGKKKTTDHPPIHPVGAPGSKILSSDHKKIYELICRRFLATLTKDAISETVDVLIDISGEEFKSSGYRLIEPNWKSIYTYFKDKRRPLPELKEEEIFDIVKIKLKEDKTKPPQRYTQGSLIGKMEQLSLGTKSTRHEIIQKLFNRKYITISPLKPTPTAFAVVEALGDYEVVKPEMTASLEKNMDLISEGKKSFEETVKESRQMLTEVMDELEKDKDKIKTNIISAQKKQDNIGDCPNCSKPLVVRTSKKKKRFVGCTGYPECRNTYSLPQKGGIIAIDKICKKCGTPIVRIKSKGKRGWELCINSDCTEKKPKLKK
jgi:DNA topoisomerase-1